ncbi:MAG TPA: hypothetical protein DD640_06315 [Clostridiales bacterium]|nr:hypothetical protein [Clostridiales bacterium]
MVFSCNIEHDPFSYSLNRYDLFVSKIFSCSFGSANPRNGVHRHACYEICLALDGCGIFNCNKSTYAINPGTLFLVSPNIEHEIICQGSLELVFYTFAILPTRSADCTWSEQDSIVDQFMWQHQTVAGNCTCLASYARFQQSYLLGGSQYAIRAVSLIMLLDCLQALTSGSVRKTARSSGQSEPQPVSANQPLADKIAAYINDHIQTPITIDELCEYAHLSPRSLYLLFRQNFQVPPARYINQLRIQVSIGYLNMGFPVTTVAERLGFSDPTSFCRLFRKSTGQSPGRYRSFRQNLQVSADVAADPANPDAQSGEK